MDRRHRHPRRPAAATAAVVAAAIIVGDALNAAVAIVTVLHARANIK